ncbi:MAG: hypothetical protein JWN69_2248 [Alphaproteobacteria bacterium]|nr:hypothetical protein [Alphaproteobacteria bacterium]
MSTALKAIHIHAFDFWLARLSVVIIAALQLLLPNDLTIGPNWLAPAVELALLVPLSALTASTQVLARDATMDHHWQVVEQRRRVIQNVAILLTAVVSLMNLAALAELIQALLSGRAGNIGQPLLLDAINIWATNLIVFTLWFWAIDRGGPANRGLVEPKDDFLFPQMTLDRADGDGPWSPGFIDYLYVSFTNAAAFSPTDTMPLTARAKMLMMLQASISLLTIALVAARAVNILA